MQIIVQRRVEGRDEVLTVLDRVNPECIVGEIKTRIEDEKGIPAVQQRLSYKGKALQNTWVVSECIIGKSSRKSAVINMVFDHDEG